MINDILEFSKTEAGKLDIEPINFELRDALADMLNTLASRAHSKGLELVYQVSPEIQDALIGDIHRLQQIIVNLVGNAIKFTQQGEILVSMNWRMLPVAVPSGAEALAALDKASHANNTFRLVVSDVNMPEMDGFQLFQRMRDRHVSVPLILMTSGARIGDVARCRKLGVAAHLTKPAKQSLLMNAIVNAVAGPSLGSETKEQTTLPADGEMSTTRALRVLLAEDNLVNQKFAVRAIEKAGHSVLVANNGREAVVAWQRETFDVVLMDVQMPVMDGFDATANIRGLEQQQETTPRTPIIAMTANAMTGDKERCLEAGMDGYVSKPVKRDLLFAEIQRLLNDA